MKGSERPEPVSGSCFFGVQRLLPLLDAFTKEITGVRNGEDIEHIHRMRVASRRLRAALPLFCTCFPEKQYRLWTAEIRKVTRALGSARDADVQIAFLNKYLRKLQEPVSGPLGSVPSPAGPPQHSLDLVLSRLQKKRNGFQEDVIHALDELEGSRVMDEIHAACREILPEHGRIRRRPRMYGLPAVAAARIGRRLLGLFSYEPWVHNPDAVTEHHAMRISAKKLRYTMEVYAPLYRRQLKKPIARVKKLQDLLGDIHDCDVWIDHITLLIMKERNRSHALHDFRHGRPYAIAPLRRLLINREKRRQRLYRQFVRFWESLQRSGIWNELRATVITGQRKAFYVKAASAGLPEQEAIQRLAMGAPALQEHCQLVTVLALRLFDQLRDLHRMGDRDRALVEYAALLHDIGWKYGDKGHQKRSARMILADEGLPLGTRERGILGLVAGFHGTNVRFAADGLYYLLSRDDQQRVRTLAAILRIADGLDYLHQQTVTDIRCTINPHEVTCDIVASGDATIEKRRALVKGDLFTEVFGREPVIQ
jgi:CHAD domain-containing protein